jgi:hypothetical protein
MRFALLNGRRHTCLDDAFAAKHMPDLGHEVKDFKVFSWRLTGWKKLDKKLTSPEFECGGHKWSGSSSVSLYTFLISSLFHTFIGGSYYFPLAILMHHRTIPFRYI